MEGAGEGRDLKCVLHHVTCLFPQSIKALALVLLYQRAESVISDVYFQAFCEVVFCIFVVTVISPFHTKMIFLT